jgi:hypothetical protein
VSASKRQLEQMSAKIPPFGGIFVLFAALLTVPVIGF